MLALPNPALRVLALGLAACAVARVRPSLDTRTLALLFALTVGLGALARAWHGRPLEARTTWKAAAIGAVAAVLVNNLPATVILTAQPPRAASALLVGLDLGPNLAVTGSLSAVLWLQAARAVGARASIATYTRLGLVLAPLSLAASLAALRL